MFTRIFPFRMKISCLKMKNSEIVLLLLLFLPSYDTILTQEQFKDNAMERKPSLLSRFREDYEFRTLTTTLFSSCITAGIATYHLIVGLLGGNMVWLFTLSFYYYALAVARIAVLISHRIGVQRGEEGEADERRGAYNYLGGGALLVLLTLAYSGVIVLVTVRGFHFNYRGNLVYVMALYAFYKIIAAIVNAVRYKKYGDFTVQTLRNYNVADGIFSIVALQSSLLSTFTGEEHALFAGTMNVVIGGIAGFAILALGTYMIVRGNHRILQIKKGKEE